MGNRGRLKSNGLARRFCSLRKVLSIPRLRTAIEALLCGAPVLIENRAIEPLLYVLMLTPMLQSPGHSLYETGGSAQSLQPRASFSFYSRSSREEPCPRGTDQGLSI